LWQRFNRQYAVSAEDYQRKCQKYLKTKTRFWEEKILVAVVLVAG
jgi:hypothetical protein